MRLETRTLYSCWPQNEPRAPQARPPERSGDRGAPRATAKGVRGGEAPRDARPVMRLETRTLYSCWPQNEPRAPQARPPERSGDRGAPRATAKGVRGGEAPRDARPVMRLETRTLYSCWPQNEPGAPQARPPERSGDRGT